jgi:hypothetical protein
VAKRIIAGIGALLVGVSIGLGAMAISSAEVPEPVRRHRHYTVSASGEKAYIGPNFCDTTITDTGFASFHNNVHLAEPRLSHISGEEC